MFERAEPADRSLRFVLASPDGTLTGRGRRAAVRGEDATGLAASVRAYFAAHPASTLVGAVPFDRGRPCELEQPAELIAMPAGAWVDGGASEDVAPAQQWVATPVPSAAEYAERVGQVARIIASGEGGEPLLRKVVLARSLVITGTEAIDPIALAGRLRWDRSVTTYAVALPDGPEARVRMLVGATPELLVGTRRGRVRSTPLAGSTRRHRDPVQDREAAEALLRSPKDRLEHAVVVDWVRERLAPFCHRLDVPATPTPVSTATMWHLGTDIHGELRDPAPSSLELALALHPTPAVCGMPPDQATSLIGELEPFDRGYFAGAVGWCNGSGDGEWFVAIRCATVEGATARLFAGAGVVAGSDPDGERRETDAKLETLLRALDPGRGESAAESITS